MTIEELRQKVYRDLDSRGLKDPSIRKRALNNVLAFIKTKETYFTRNDLNLPSDKDSLKSAYQNYKGKVLNSAESSVINTMYEHYKGVKVNQNTVLHDAKKSEDNRDQRKDINEGYSNSSEIEKVLISGNFYTLNELNEGEKVPSVPGIYCIKIKKGIKFPKEYGNLDENGIIYIGIATKSLRERLWEEELNHKRAATFFRSIGAMLGFLPPKGSLIGKKNRRNYKFNKEDTNKIKDWIAKSLKVIFIPLSPDQLGTVETSLIKKIKPLVNIKKNPCPSQAIKEARKRCVDFALSKPDDND